MNLNTILLSSLGTLAGIGVMNAGEAVVPTAPTTVTVPPAAKSMSADFGRTNLIWSPDEFKASFIPLLHAIVQEEPREATSVKVSHQVLVIEAKRREELITYGKWTAIVVVTGTITVVTWGTGAIVTSAIGTAIGNGMGLSGAAATSAGLAWLGGGALLSGGGGMATGAVVIAAGGVAIDYVAVKTIESGVGYLMSSNEFNTATGLMEESKRRHSFERAMEALQEIRRAQLLGGNGHNVHLARLSAGMLLLQMFEDLPESSPAKNIITEQLVSLFSHMKAQLPGSSFPDFYLGRIATMQAFNDGKLDLKKLSEAKEHFSQSLAKEELNHEPALALAQLLRMEEAPLEAIKVLNKTINVTKTRGENNWYGRSRPEVLQAKGLALYHSRDIHGAIDVLEEVNDIEPNPVTLSWLLSLYNECALSESDPDKRFDYMDRGFKHGYKLISIVKDIDLKVTKMDSSGLVKRGSMLNVYLDPACLAMRCGLEVVRKLSNNKDPANANEVIKKLVAITNIYFEETKHALPLEDMENVILYALMESYNKNKWATTWSLTLPQLSGVTSSTPSPKAEK